MARLKETVEKTGTKVIDYRALELVREVAEMVTNGSNYDDVLEKAKKLYSKKRRGYSE